MDNKEKVKELLHEAIKQYQAPGLRNVEGFLLDWTYRIDELYKPNKVKLPKAAYEWMDKHKNIDFCEFNFTLFFLKSNYNDTDKLSGEELRFRKFVYDDDFSISKLLDAYRYGYELEETEEERIKREMLEKYEDMLTLKNPHFGESFKHTLIDTLYNIAKG